MRPAEEERLTVYEPDNAIRHGMTGLLRGMYREIAAGRWLVWQLFLKEVKAGYQQSVLGVAWVLLMPAGTVLMFAALGRAGVLRLARPGEPYLLFGLLGMAFWQIVAAGLAGGTNALVEAGSVIRKVNFPREALVLAAVGRALLDAALIFGAALVCFAAYGVAPSWGVWLAPVLMLPLFLLTLGLSLVFSILNGVVRDFQKVIPFGVMVLMFLTPVFWSPAAGKLSPFIAWNPLYHLVDAPRELILHGVVPHPAGYAWSVALAVAVFLACWVLFHLAETRIAERV